MHTHTVHQRAGHILATLEQSLNTNHEKVPTPLHRLFYLKKFDLAGNFVYSASIESIIFLILRTALLIIDSLIL